MAQHTTSSDAYKHANETTNHVQHIIMLYDGAIGYVGQAQLADLEQDHETRYNMIDKALSIMRGLNECLDFNNHPEISHALNNYYEAISTMLIATQASNNRQEMCEEILNNLRIIKQTWHEISIECASKK